MTVQHTAVCRPVLTRPRGGTFRRAAALGACSLIAFLLSGCAATILRPTEADDSRREAQRLGDEVARLEARVAGLEAELAASHVDRPDPLPEGISVPVRIEFARWGGIVPIASAPRLRLYLRPLDAFGRLTHPLGPLAIEVIEWPVDGAPEVIAEEHLTLIQIALLYRSSFSGTHYSVDVPLRRVPDMASTVLVRCRLENTLTGTVTTAEMTIDPREARRRAADSSAPSTSSE